jgi:dTDP-4-dehydrorhamnose reductase
MNILVTGAHGQLGSELQQLAQQTAAHQFTFTDRNDLDITNAAAVREAIKLSGTQCLINCAAYTAVDKAETDLETAMAINSTGAAILAAASRDAGARFVHVSTDYVFSGTGNTPYHEEDPVDPVNAYGLTKQKGEAAVLAENEESIIIRTSWVYSEFGANFVKTMIRLMASRTEVGVVADQYGSPTYAADLAAAIMHIVDGNQWVPGIYHYSNEGDITWFQFAAAIREMIAADCKVLPLTTEQYPTTAKRPAYSVMNKDKIQQTFGLRLQPWRQSLHRCIQRLAQNSLPQ